MTPHTQARFVSTGIAQRLLGVSRSTLYRWEDEGKLKPRRLHGTGHRRYLLADLRDVIPAATSTVELARKATELEAGR